MRTLEKVYFLSHEWYDGEYDHITDIAVYSTQQKAQKALLKFKHCLRFRKYPDGFNISEYIVDEDNWTEGFFTY